MAAGTLISPTTAGANGPLMDFREADYRYGATFVHNGLAGIETVKFQYTVDGGSNWLDYYVDGSLLELTATNSAETVWARLPLRCVKSATVASVGVYSFTGRS